MVFELENCNLLINKEILFFGGLAILRVFYVTL